MELSKIVADNVRDYAQLEPIHPSMAGEDFCDFMPVTMPVFAFIGSNGEKGCPDWHSRISSVWMNHCRPAWNSTPTRR